uniref:DUF4537 domain-containing protein n=1 Tax=Salvator merianae TaxID=96440 RepID=A0A8D0CD62_SALMN
MAHEKAVKNFNNSLDIAGIPVLARRETDGYYYPGTVIKGTEAESKTVLVRFAKSFAEDEETTCTQRTACSDILEYVNGMRHSILPGDKVLAPWKPKTERYGPGTVILGLETRDPLREKEDEEITVSFWNGKKMKVPLGVALWISPRQWEKTVEMIHRPLTSRKQFEGQLHRPDYYICSCGSILTSKHECTLSSFHRFQQPYFSSICPYYRSFHHTCSLLRPTQCSLCPKYTCCWWQPSLAERCRRDVEEYSSKPTTQLLAVEGPPKEKFAATLSSSSSSCSNHAVNTDSMDKETSLTKAIMVDHAVNTDSSLFDKPKLQEIMRPDWKYWKRSHPSSYCKSQGPHSQAQTYLSSSMSVLIDKRSHKK